MDTCLAVTRHGERCQNTPEPGHTTCGIHAEKACLPDSAFPDIESIDEIQIEHDLAALAHLPARFDVWREARGLDAAQRAVMHSDLIYLNDTVAAIVRYINFLETGLVGIMKAKESCPQ